MRVRFTRSVAVPVLAAILGCGPVMSELARAGAADRADSGNGVLSILPGQSTLNGRRATAQLVATARGADGMVQDQTRSVEWISSNPSVAVVTFERPSDPQEQRDGDDRRAQGQPRGEHDSQGGRDGRARSG